MHIFTNPNFDFVKWRWHAIALSWIIILAGLAVIWTKGMPKGVEFSGGTIVILQFDQNPNVEQVRSALSKGVPDGGNAIVASICARNVAFVDAAHQNDPDLGYRPAVTGLIERLRHVLKK